MIFCICVVFMISRASAQCSPGEPCNVYFLALAPFDTSSFYYTTYEHVMNNTGNGYNNKYGEL